MYASIHHMKRTTIFIPETLERDLQLYARRAGRPVASVVREAVEQYLTSAEAARLPSFVGVGASGRADIADRHEELLFRSLDRQGDRDRDAPARHAQRSRAARRRRG